MRYGILGDVHANLGALRKALELLRSEQVDRIVSVGDVVGYGAAPSACIELLREVEAVVVQGNHDAACVGAIDARCFNQAARTALDWTRTQLDEEELEWLEQLPLHVELEHCEVTHGTFDEPARFDYFLGVDQGAGSLERLTKPVGFVGHSHVPISVFRPKEAPLRVGYSPDSVVKLDELLHAVVNVGSVGQPRDEDPRLACGVYDAERGTVEILRAHYDIEREASRIRAAGLPSVLADRLFLGI